jgi:hypothetical protein
MRDYWEQGVNDTVQKWDHRNQDEIDHLTTMREDVPEMKVKKPALDPEDRRKLPMAD